MDVRSSRVVVARKDRLELDNAVRVSPASWLVSYNSVVFSLDESLLLNATKESLVQVGSIVLVAIAGCHDAAVDPSSVTMPQIDKDCWDRLASVHVDVLHIYCRRSTSTRGRPVL